VYIVQYVSVCTYIYIIALYLVPAYRYIYLVVVIGQAQPLCQEQEVWTSDVPLTPGALQGKRDTFWDTAPMYDGRREIWDALRAACEAVDLEDYDLAQAILQGANILLPRGMI